jgi:ActR/RegA family two-component response regulator
MKSILIVEDIRKIWEEYKEYCEELGAFVHIAENLDEAKTAIDMVAFDVALVDIRLDENDDENVDGLRVLEIIAEKDDGTRAIVLTGYGTVKITRDAIIRYGAIDVIDKENLNLSFFNERLKNELKEAAISSKKRTTLDWYVMKPESMNVIQWESKVMDICQPGGITPLHQLFDNLIQNLSPVIAINSKEPMLFDKNAGICCGVFWSRKIGHAVLIALAKVQDYQEIRNYISKTKYYEIPQMLTKEVGTSVYDKQIKKIIGLAYILPKFTWDIFKKNLQK